MRNNRQKKIIVFTGIAIIFLYITTSIVESYTTLDGEAQRKCYNIGYRNAVHVDRHFKRVECFNEKWKVVVFKIEKDEKLTKIEIKK
ncbi:MAG: hypothetical protein WAV09_04165 [Minisyncoccia bacterium]